jgi:hypothetical protein
MSLGAGFSAAGFSPAGTGDVDTASAPPTTNMVDEKGAQQSARAIDAATGDYILNADGRFRGMPRVRQLVLLRIRTLLNSSAINRLGLEQLAGDRDSGTPRRFENSLRAALSDLVTAKLVTIIDITSAVELPTRLRGALRWRDLTTNQEYVEPI